MPLFSLTISVIPRFAVCRHSYSRVGQTLFKRTLSEMSGPASFKLSKDVQDVEGVSFTTALIQLGAIGPDKSANLIHARSKINEAVQGAGVRPDVVVLPEVFNSPYGPQHFKKYAEVIGWSEGSEAPAGWDVERCQSDSVKMLSQASRENKIWLFGGSIPERCSKDPNVLYNTATVFSPEGNLVAIHRKLHLFDINIPNQITFREMLLKIAFGKIGIGICYDIRFPEMAMIAARKGCIAMIYPGAFNLTTGPLHWELLARARAVDNQIYVAVCSPARDMSSGYHAWGHSTIVNPMAQIVSTTDENESIVYGFIDINEINKARRGLPITVQRRFDVYSDISALSNPITPSRFK
ncbi:carbon-nitrogen hydrolase [Melampsora americana]|nr:carbon-nitrogen hydrolase [Melampsora americana]